MQKKIASPVFWDSVVRRPFPLPAAWKQRLGSWALPRDVWTLYRCRQLHAEYTRRREHYAQLAAQQELVYRETEVVSAIRQRLTARGYTPSRRRMGEVHTFACVPLFGWHEHLLPDLYELGPVTHFDYTALGFEVEELARTDRHGIARRREMVKLIVPALREAHRQRPVDWVFCYGGGQDTSPQVIRQITDELGIPTVNMSLDDKQGWAGPWNDECRTGAVDITAVFDMFMTSARVACEWHMVEGGRPIYMPEGFSKVSYRPMLVTQDIPVSFIGAAYGFRMSAIGFLRRHGVDVHTFGPRWGTQAVWGDDQVRVINRSLINLGMGGIEYSESLTNVKTRDFEIPGTGGGVYLTSFNPDLAQHFRAGEEILCYRNRDEMLELVRYYLARPEEACAIARRGRERCLQEHRWLHRYQKSLQVLGVLEEETLAVPQLESTGKSHV
jgi:hypothetical protein